MKSDDCLGRSGSHRGSDLERNKGTTPRISVVTPSYNQSEYLETTINSVLSQDYLNTEYIIIDGGSSDGSVEIIERYSSRLAFWCSEKDGGQADALRKGFERSTGDIMCWLNSDDVFLPRALSSVVDYFNKHPRVEAVSAGAYFIDENGDPLPLRVKHYTLGVGATYNRFRFYGMDGVYQQATFWHRSAYEAIGGIDPTWQFLMDYDLFTRLARLRRFGKLPRLVACFRRHNAAKTLTIPHVAAAEMRRYTSKYGRYRLGVFFARALYWRYRIPSLIRRFVLCALTVLGIVRRTAVRTVAAER